MLVHFFFLAIGVGEIDRKADVTVITHPHMYIENEEKSIMFLL